MPRTVLLYLLPAALVATAWARLIDGVDERRVLALLALALAPALVRPWWGRALAATASSFAAAWIVYGISPWALVPFDDRRFFGPLLSRFREGVLDFYDVSLPFSAVDRPGMSHAVLVGIFAFALALALAIAARRPLAASVVLLSGSVWPATLVDGDDVARGALTLAAVLALLAFGGRRPTRAPKPAVLLAGLLVAAAVGASTSEAVAKPEFLHWKGWDFYDKPADPVGVGYVWNATYGDLKWPEQETTVLKVRGPKRNLYWRATTLDTFFDHRWVEDLTISRISEGVVDVTETGSLLVPDRARDQSRWIRTDVQVEALRDQHLVGPSMPVAYDPGDAGAVAVSSDGVAVASQILPRGAEYTVWSYAPRPKPEQLARAGPPARSLVRRYLEVVRGVPLPAFGAPNRDATVRTLMRSTGAAPYEAVYDRARDVVGNPRNAYAAVVALEAWFRSEGGFVYDETPTPTGGVPPLLAFLRDQHGYCQHFAGAMTLMLRSLGIPSRVAVGFTSGTLSDDKSTWTVTDHDAHAWVEVWFPGWGWLPFDPTPARGQLSGPYSWGSTAFDAAGARNVLDASGGGGQTSRIASKLSEARVGEQFQPDGLGGGGYVPVVREHGASLIKLLALLAAAAALAIVLVKQGVRGRRYLTRDARRLAVASRQELVDFLADQGVLVPRSATPRELARELQDALAVDGEAFARALALARYAPPRASRSASRRMRRELWLLRRSLRRRLGVPRRLRGAVSLRSLAT
jgi:protein-glutamine gamma-glutamyltransferase